ncbi:MAG: phosphonate ABC transporter substrate-binding protein [Calditrichaeota bacterium]|nr:MAG: phosphonate ABC transporter substrate-binding protein [Calditrichota bacterium]
MKLTKLTATLIFIAEILLTGYPGHAQINLKFGVYTTDKPTAMIKQFRPIITAIEENLTRETGQFVHIDIQVAPSYEKGILDLVQGRVDFARFGPASYIEAKGQNHALRILAMESKNGKKRFYGIICVAKGSPLKSMADLKNKRFAFGDERSTIGRYLSQLHLMKSGITAENLGYFEYLGRHDKVGTAVALGQFDAGALKESTFNKLVAKGEPLQALARFENVTKPWVASADLDNVTFKVLQKILLEMKDKEALKALKKDGFATGSHADYQIVENAIQTNRGFFRRTE